MPAPGPHVYCGRIWIPWEAISDLCQLLAFQGISKQWEIARDSEFDIFLLCELDRIRDILHKQGRKRVIALDRLLLVSSDRLSSECKDHIFAILGLLPDKSSSIRLDYGQPTSVVYQMAMVGAIKCSGNNGLLYQAVGPHGDIDLPSWCVDFSKRHWNTGVADWELYHFFHHDEVYDAVNQSTSIEYHHDPKIGQLTIPAAAVIVVSRRNGMEGRMRNHEPRSKSDNLYFERFAYLQNLLYTSRASMLQIAPVESTFGVEKSDSQQRHPPLVKSMNASHQCP